MTLKEPPNLTKILKIKEEEIEEGKISNLFFLETSAKKYKTKTNLSCFSLNRGDSSINEENGEADKLDRSYALEKMRWNRIGGKKGRKGERERARIGKTREGEQTRDAREDLLFRDKFQLLSTRSKWR